MTSLTLAALGAGLLLVSAGWSGQSVVEILKEIIAGRPLPPAKGLFEVSEAGGGTGDTPTFPSVEESKRFSEEMYGSPLPKPGAPRNVPS